MTREIRTKEIETTDGIVEYDVVECASCEQELKLDNAYEFTMGQDYREGWACPSCVDQGPISFPKWEPVFSFDLRAAIFGWGLFPLVSLVMLLISVYPNEEEDLVEFSRGVLFAIVGLWLWVGLPYVLDRMIV